eukprot:TRINITY_DN8355_c0_g1_i2.p1 TRINITY_DN8355_c0_g1~~TRINITY_DN8355_c0_g1_i2.p1  ORF type:complete len:105 (+),score=12.98 TRINITY_DN8355_c0_g1_i2:235-549(+)
MRNPVLERESPANYSRSQKLGIEFPRRSGDARVADSSERSSHSRCRYEDIGRMVSESSAAIYPVCASTEIRGTLCISEVLLFLSDLWFKRRFMNELECERASLF